MKLFRVAVCVIRETGVTQVPMFILDGDFHGLTSERAAEGFAESMVLELIGGGDGVEANACAVEL